VTEAFSRIWPSREDGLTAADLASALGRRDDTRPWVAVNMIATADGRATIRGRTGPIANRADYELFHALRAAADAVMVGAETVRVEGYGPMDQLAVLVTRTARVPADTGLLRTAENRVAALTPSPDAELPPCAAQVSYLRGSLADGLRALHDEHGVRTLLCEGGPQLLGDLVRAGLADELHLVIAPKLAAGDDPLTIVTGPELDPPVELALRSVHESGGYLFLRYAIGLLE
jgi:riboflavin biosynthesis pyrimidine reductase